MVCAEATVGTASATPVRSQRIDARGVQAEACTDLADAVHVGGRRNQGQAGLGEVFREALIAAGQHVLLARGVEVVRTGLQAGLGHVDGVAHERADGVADDLAAGRAAWSAPRPCARPRRFRSARSRCRAPAHRFFDALAVAAGGDEGHAQVTQVFCDQAAGVAAGAVDDDGIIVVQGVAQGSLRWVRRQCSVQRLRRGPSLLADAGGSADGRSASAAGGSRRPRSAWPGRRAASSRSGTRASDPRRRSAAATRRTTFISSVQQNALPAAVKYGCGLRRASWCSAPHDAPSRGWLRPWCRCRPVGTA